MPTAEPLSNHTLALRLRQYAEILNSAPASSPAEKYGLTATAADLLEAARRLDRNVERRMS
jgi:hypothetical protein